MTTHCFLKSTSALMKLQYGGSWIKVNILQHSCINWEKMRTNINYKFSNVLFQLCPFSIILLCFASKEWMEFLLMISDIFILRTEIWTFFLIAWIFTAWTIFVTTGMGSIRWCFCTKYVDVAVSLNLNCNCSFDTENVLNISFHWEIKILK